MSHDGSPKPFASEDARLVVGLTGSIASGKSTVAAMLREDGAEIIDADVVYHELATPGSQLQRSIADRFGPSVIRDDGKLDRRRLGELVFRDPAALRDLDRITHPAVVSEVRRRVARSAAPLVVIEAVKLVESGLGDDVDALWLVTADPRVREERLRARSGLSVEAARARMAPATSAIPRQVIPNTVIDNSGDVATTRSAVDAAIRALRLHGPIERPTAKGGVVNQRLSVDVYIDFVCPYVHAAVAWLQEVRRQLGDDRVAFNWRFFPLEQVNAPAEIEETVWDLPPENRSQARNSMHAAIAAMQQGNDAFERFLPALLALKHEEGQDHGKRATLEEAATRAGLDMDRFRADLDDRSLLVRIRDDYLHGRNAHGVFGTPTLVFPDGESAYIQVRPAPPAADALPLWEDVVRIIERPVVREIKRPRRA